nr:Chain P, NC-P1 SUBSTRATE PEPTIDE [synthetic construct]
RQANFLGKIN